MAWMKQRTAQQRAFEKPIQKTSTAARLGVTLALGDNTFIEPLDFISEGEVWWLQSATVYVTNPVTDNLYTMYVTVKIYTPAGFSNVAVEGMLYRQAFGQDEKNIQLPVFHADYLQVDLYGNEQLQNQLNFVCKFVKATL